MQPIKAQRTTITIAGVEMDGFKLPNGQKGLSQAQMAEVINAHPESGSRFLKSETAKALPHKSFPVSHLDFADESRNDNLPKRVKIIPPELVAAFWAYQAERGNKKALALVIALAQETLDRRLDAAFGDVRSEQEREAATREVRLSWEHERQFCSDTHEFFQSSCYRYGFRPSTAHDAITKAVTGMTANEHRKKLPLVAGEADIGLNHIDSPATQQLIAKIKLAFSRQRKGSMMERIERAIKEVRHG